MSQHPRLKTERILLRKLALRDADTIFSSYAQDAEVTRYLPWKPHLKKTETIAFIKRFLADYHTGLSLNWIIEKSETTELTGMIALKINGLKTTLGFALAKHYWGQGVATEAASAVIDWTLLQPEFELIEAFCDADNSASASVLEKAGMKRESLLRRFGVHPNVSPNPRDCWRFTLIKHPITEEGK